MPPPTDDLRTLLLAETAAVQKFAKLLQTESDALTEQGLFDQLPDLTAEKNLLAQELGELAVHRNAALRTLGFGADHAGTQAAAQAHPEIAPIWETLLAHSAEARDLNLQNGTLIDTHLQHVRLSLDALGVVTGANQQLYNAQGRASGLPSGKSLATG